MILRTRAVPLLAAAVAASVLLTTGDIGAARPGHDSGGFGVLETLINTPGVSTREQLVRDRIRAILPVWARPEVDAKGNLLVVAGP